MLRSKWILALALGFLLGGCASLSQRLNPSGPLSDQEIANARANDVPVIIYDTSFSHGVAPPQATEPTVKLINVSYKQINSITLLVVSCTGTTSGEDGVYATLSLKGPFAPKTVYESHSKVDDSAGWTAGQSSQMMIKAADVLFQDGSKRSFTDDVSKLFSNQTPNYCAKASGPH